MNPRRWLISLLVLLVGSLANSFAQKTPAAERLVPDLVADTGKIAAGRPFTVGVHLKMAPGWHTYWQYPGESGSEPKITWTLPDGFKAGPIQWPIPTAHIDDGDLLTYIYEKEVLLLVEVTPPAQLPAGDISIKAQLSWLVCEKICVPGDGEVELVLPTGENPEPADAELFARWRALLPKAATPPFQLSLKSETEAVTVGLKGLPKDASAEFFPLPKKGIKTGHPKPGPIGGDGARSIELPITKGGVAGARWEGVVVVAAKAGGTRQGWSVSSDMATASVEAPAGAAPAAPMGADSGLGWKLIVAFLGGLIMNVMPCVLPVIALKIFGFVKQAGQEPARIFRLGLAFTAGVFAFFFGLAIIVTQLRGAFNFGYQFQNPWLLTGLIVLVFVFSLNLLGVFEIALSSDTATTLSNLSGREGYGGAFLHGLFTTLLGTSCTAPFLGSSLGYAVTQPAPIVFLLFGAIAAGLACPYLLLTARPAWLRYVPKPGVWMERAKQLMGFVMLALVVWLIGVLGTRGVESSTAVSWFLLCVGVACWIFGVSQRKAGTWVLIALIAGAGYFFFLRDAFPVGEKRVDVANVPGGIEWEPYSDERLAAAVMRGEPVFIDFTADWCINCKVYEKVVLNTAGVRKAFRDKKIVALQADWTNADPLVTRALKRYERVSVPLYVLYRPGESQPVVMDGLTQNILLSALASIHP